MVFGRRPARVMPFSDVCLAAAAALPVVCIVPEEVSQPLLHVQRLQERHFAQDAEVFERIREQFERNAAQWPSRLDKARSRLQHQNLVIGDWVLELVFGPVPALESRVKGPYLIVDFVGPGQQIAVLETGGTQFKDKRRFHRSIWNLARYTARHHLRAP